MSEEVDRRPRFVAPRGMLERKPKHGQPCTNCGLCCVSSLCELGAHVFQRERLPGPCPALVQDDEHHYACDVARHPQKYKKPRADQTIGGMRRAALLLIWAGLGCDARFNGEPGNPEFYAVMDKYDRDNAKLIRWARKLWGLK